MRETAGCCVLLMVTLSARLVMVAAVEAFACDLVQLNPQVRLLTGCDCSEMCSTACLQERLWTCSLAASPQVLSLTLSDLDLRQIPASIETLTALTSITLDNNNLIDLPDGIGRLTKLTYLSFAYNMITTIPSTLGGLSVLHTLVANSNLIGSLPDTMSSLLRLARLTIAFNRFSSLPEFLFTNLTGLLVLIADGNYITALPQHFQPPPSYVSHHFSKISLRNNMLSVLPESIGELRVDLLDLSDNFLTSLPESLGTIQSLYNLELAKNNLTSLPESFRESSFDSLILSDNLFTSIPPQVIDNPVLHRLDMGWNMIRTVPSDLLGSATLHVLSLEGNQINTLSDCSNPSLCSISTLNLASNWMTSLPELCNQLNSLNVGDNCLVSLPSSLTHLNLLVSIYLDDNGLDCEAIKQTSVLIPLIGQRCDPSRQQQQQSKLKCWNETNQSNNTTPPSATSSTSIADFLSWMVGKHLFQSLVSALLIFAPVPLLVVLIGGAMLARRIHSHRQSHTPFFYHEIGGHLHRRSVRDCGVIVTPPDSIVFASGQLVPIKTKVSAVVTLRSVKKHKLRYHMSATVSENDKDKYTLDIQPCEGVLPLKKDVLVTVTLVMNCSMHINNSPLIQIELPDEPNTPSMTLPVSAESEVSGSIDPDELNLQNVLGSGTYGTVYRTVWRGREVAVKSYNFSLLQDSSQVQQELQREVAVISTLDIHPNIVEFIGTAIAPTRNKLLLVIEYMPAGDLGSLLKKRPLSLRYKVRVAYDIARGMEFLHRSRILHRDLKPSNVLVASLESEAPVCAKLSDFGTSKLVEDELAKFTTKTIGVGTPVFMAPEIIDASSKYSFQVDVFSYGVLLWNLWTQREPYDVFHNPMALFKFVSEGKRMKIPDDLPAPLQETTSQSWDQDPLNRPTFSAICETLREFMDSSPIRKSSISAPPIKYQ